MVGHESRLSPRHLADVSNQQIIHGDLGTACGFGVMGGDGGGVGEVLCVGLLAVRHHDHVGAGDSFRVEPVIVAIRQLVGDMLVLQVVFAAVHQVAVGGSELGHGGGGLLLGGILFNINKEATTVKVPKDTYNYEGLVASLAVDENEVSMEGDTVTLPAFGIAVIK